MSPKQKRNKPMDVPKRPRGALYCSFPLEGANRGKHTVAFPNLKSVHITLKKMGGSITPIYIGYARKPGVVIPGGNEAIIFVKKNS